MPLPLHRQRLSLDHAALTHLLAHRKNLLIVQDLNGVCISLVKDPLTRQMDPRYLAAMPAFDEHFFVLSNGEHVGSRGVNRIVDQAQSSLDSQGLYLSGLAAGGVQCQTRQGEVSHPGVSDVIMAFLEMIPLKMKQCIREFFTQQDDALDPEILQTCLNTAVLDNKVSPTANLNVFYDMLSDRPYPHYTIRILLAFKVLPGFRKAIVCAA